MKGIDSPRPVFADEVAAALTQLSCRAHYGADLDRARACVLDWLGCVLAGSAEEVSRRTRDAMGLQAASASSGSATVIGTGLRASARDAALANGVAAHALDFDDGHAWTGSHPSAPIVSATVAMAESAGANQ